MKIIINILSAFALFLGLVITSFLIVIIYQGKPNEITLPVVYLVASLLGSGLLGTVLIEVFQSVVQKQIERFFEKGRGAGVLEAEVRKMLTDRNALDSILAKNEKFANLVLSIVGDEEQPLFLSRDMQPFDTVIVGTRWSTDFNIKHKLYFCQKNRTFQSVKYIALYAEKYIQFVAKIEQGPLTQTQLDQLPNSSEIKDYLDEMASSDVNYVDVYKLSTSGIPEDGRLDIYHDKPYALVRKQIYSNFQSLLKAKNTEEIQRQ